MKLQIMKTPAAIALNYLRTALFSIFHTHSCHIFIFHSGIYISAHTFIVAWIRPKRLRAPDNQRPAVHGTVPVAVNWPLKNAHTHRRMGFQSAFHAANGTSRPHRTCN